MPSRRYSPARGELEGETVVSTLDIHDDKTFSTEALNQELPNFPALQQCGVRYRWGDEETFGMLERSNPSDKISRDSAPAGRSGHRSLHRSEIGTPTSASIERKWGRDKPRTLVGEPSMLSTKGPPRPSMLKPPAIWSASPVAA